MKWLLLTVTMISFPASAQSFEQIWEDRIVMGITPPAQPFDEEQFSQEVARRSIKEELKKKQNTKSCMTLREAREEYGNRYLSWRGNHCWYAPSSGDHHNRRRHRNVA